MEYLHYQRRLRHFISTPFITALIIPLVVLDICAEIYHRVCFPLYGLPYVKRSKYIKIDRHKLQYLNPPQKIFCMYCSYANGWLLYASVIAGDTERYWCGIQHQSQPGFIPPKHHRDFVPYGDEAAWQRRYHQGPDAPENK